MKLKRHKQNPLLEPIQGSKWESGAVFNCGTVYKNGQIHMLYRAIGEYDNYISRLGYAVSKDGVNFKRNNKPIFEPIEIYEKWACEDPRITEIDGRFLITYTAFSEPPLKLITPRTALVSTTDFITFERHGIITPDLADEKDVVLFPEKIDGKYVMLHRPHNWTKNDVDEQEGKLYQKEKTTERPLKEKPGYFPEKPSIWIAYSDNLEDWYGHKVVMEPEEDWESVKIGAGPPPIKTDKGWLLIYHGVSELLNSTFKKYDGEIYDKVYKAGAALLDLKDPSKLIARSKTPILEPKEDYEIYGDVPNVVFPEGMIVVNNELYVYYGAADKRICLATCKLDDIVNYLWDNKKSFN